MLSITPARRTGTLAHLPFFTPVDFTGAVSCGNESTGNPQNGIAFTILDDNGNVLTLTQLGNLAVDISYV
jgi:hypothetical protein